MKAKQLLCTLLAAAAVLSLLPACGPGGSGEGSGAETKQAADTENSLTVWCWDPAFNIYAMQEAEKVYQQDHPEFRLNIVETPWEDIQTKMITAATSGDLKTLPDIALMQDMAFQKNLANYPELFTDLSETGISFGDFAAAKLSYSSLDGKHYGVPFDNGASVAVYRTDILEQAGYTLNDLTDITWSRFYEIGMDVLEKTGTPLLSAQARTPDLLSEMFQSAGGDLFRDDGSANIVGNDAILESVEIYSQLVSSGIVVEVNDWDQYIGSMNTGNVAGVMNGCWILASIQTAEDQSGLWGMTNMPRLDKHPDATHYSNQGGSSWLVTSVCSDVSLAADFLGSTFGGSVPFYETILSAGALATYLPAGDSDAYSEPQEFFGGEAIYETITEFAGKVPSSNTGVYFYEARDALGVALVNINSGGSIEEELQAAEDEVRFQMGD